MLWADLKQLDPGNERGSIVKAHLDDIGEHDFHVLNSSFELVVVIVPFVGVDIQDAVVQGLQALDLLLEGALTMHRLLTTTQCIRKQSSKLRLACQIDMSSMTS